MTLHLVEEVAGERTRIVTITGRPLHPRLFEMVVPRDATITELERFLTEAVKILRQRRANDVTKRERPGR